MADNLFKYIPSKVFWPMIMGYLALILFFIFAFSSVFGEDFKFNMTDILNNETKQLERCIAGTNATSCSRIYGGNMTHIPSALEKLKDMLHIPYEKAYGMPVLHGFAYGNGSVHNVTCCMAPQIQKCDPDDESVNVTGMCDPDWNDTGVEK